MTNNRKQIEDFIMARKELVWYVRDHRKLDDASIVEAVLNYGDWDDVQELIRIMGMKHAADVFRTHSTPDKFGRTNYYPDVSHYFTLYFNKYA